MAGQYVGYERGAAGEERSDRVETWARDYRRRPRFLLRRQSARAAAERWSLHCRGENDVGQASSGSGTGTSRTIQNDPRQFGSQGNRRGRWRSAQAIRARPQSGRSQAGCRPARSASGAAAHGACPVEGTGRRSAYQGPLPSAQPPDVQTLSQDRQTRQSADRSGSYQSDGTSGRQVLAAYLRRHVVRGRCGTRIQTVATGGSCVSHTEAIAGTATDLSPKRRTDSRTCLALLVSLDSHPDCRKSNRQNVARDSFAHADVASG